jgi:hypothetical protein
MKKLIVVLFLISSVQCLFAEKFELELSVGNTRGFINKTDKESLGTNALNNYSTIAARYFFSNKYCIELNTSSKTLNEELYDLVSISSYGFGLGYRIYQNNWFDITTVAKISRVNFNMIYSCKMEPWRISGWQTGIDLNNNFRINKNLKLGVKCFTNYCYDVKEKGIKCSVEEYREIDAGVAGGLVLAF